MYRELAEFEEGGAISSAILSGGVHPCFPSIPFSGVTLDLFGRGGIGENHWNRSKDFTEPIKCILDRLEVSNVKVARSSKTVGSCLAQEMLTRFFRCCDSRVS